MRLFQPGARHRDARTRRLYAAYEVAYTIVDFSAATCFIVGSVMFFYKAWETPGTWLFLIGSILFALKPTLRLAREIHYVAAGNLAPVVENLEEEP